MKFQTLLFTILGTLVTISAGSPHDLSSRHARIAHRAQPIDTRGINTSKRCKPRPQTNPGNNTSSHAASGAPPPAPANPNPSPLPPPPSTNAGNVIHVQSSCGEIGATEKTTPTTGPNGSIDWLNCGINNGGWSPSYVRIQDLVAKNLYDAVASPNSAFKACAAFVPYFEKYGGMFGIPPIMIASFAMQESSCNPHAVGGAGEQGLMQITVDKCGPAPGGNCQDLDFNIRTGAKFFSDLVNGNGGNVLLAIGVYNGWHKGLTYGAATAAAKTSCCRCQNNLDYLHQFLNGWLQDINAQDTSPRLGKYFNLDIC